MGSKPNLSVKRSVVINTMINFDGDFDGYRLGDGTCKQALSCPYPVKQLNVLWSSGFTYANSESLFRVSQTPMYVNRTKTTAIHVVNLLSIKWNSIKICGPAHEIVTKTEYKTLLGYLFCLKLDLVQLFPIRSLSNLQK